MPSIFGRDSEIPFLTYDELITEAQNRF